VRVVKGELLVKSSQFEGNSGEAVSDIKTYGNTTVDSCQFENPRASYFASSIFNHRGVLVVSKSNFRTNSTDTLRFSFLVSKSSEIEVKGSEFFGSGLLVGEDSKLFLYDSTFRFVEFILNAVPNKCLTCAFIRWNQVNHSSLVEISDATESWIYNSSFISSVDRYDAPKEKTPVIFIKNSVNIEISYCSFTSQHHVAAMAIGANNDNQTTNATHNWFGSPNGPTSCCTQSHGNSWEIYAGVDFSFWALVRVTRID